MSETPIFASVEQDLEINYDDLVVGAVEEQPAAS